jgi:hypothetical protein
MRSPIVERCRPRNLIAALALVAAAGCAGSAPRLYPDPGLPRAEISTIGTHEIYWGSDSHGGGPIIESVDGSVLCKSSAYCLWYVHVLPGPHVIRVRWDERPDPVKAPSGEIVAAESDVYVRRVDIALETEAGRDYRIDQRVIAEVPALVSGHATKAKQYEPFVTMLDSLGFNVESDSGARPFDAYTCSCVGAVGTEAKAKCPRCPASP